MMTTKKTSFIAFILVLALAFPSVVVQAASTKLNMSECTLAVGQKQQLTLRNATGKVTWSTSAKKVATVSKKGVVTAKKAGSAVIIAKYKGKNYACVITVVKKVSLNKTKVSLNVGDTYKLKLKNGTASVFVSEDDSIATVSSKGVIKGKAKGKTTITVLDSANNVYTCKVTISSSGTSTGKNANIPSDAKSYMDHYYKIYTQNSISWEDAKKKCVELGGHLVTITSKGEQDFIEKINSSNERLWIGGYCDSNYKWYWVTGEKWSYTNWGAGEPSGGHENSAAVWPKYWNDMSSDNLWEQNGYICEWENGDKVLKDNISDKSSASQLSTDDKFEITLWDICTPMDSDRSVYDAALKELKEKYPGIKVTERSFDSETYREKIKAAAKAGELPDIFFTWAGSFLGDFVDSNKVYCLDDALKGYIKNGDITDAMLENSSFNGKHYGIPMTYNTVFMYANMDLLNKAGYSDIPETYDEFLKCCDALKDIEVYPFGCSANQNWVVSEYLESMVEKNIGADALKEVFLGKATWDNYGIADAVDEFQRMIKNGYFDPRSSSLGYGEDKTKFLNGEYAFYIRGSWDSYDFAASGLNVKAGEFPVMNTKKAKIGELIGGPSDTLAVSVSSDNAGKVAAYAAEFGKLVSKYGYLNGMSLPSWKIDYNDSKKSGLIRETANKGLQAKDFVLFGDTIMSSEESAIYYDVLSGVYSMEIDGQEFVKKMASYIR